MRLNIEWCEREFEQTNKYELLLLAFLSITQTDIFIRLVSRRICINSVILMKISMMAVVLFI